MSAATLALSPLADTEAALRHFRDRVGLRVVAVDEPPEVPVRLTYLDLGNTYLQLVEPLALGLVAAVGAEVDRDPRHLAGRAGMVGRQLSPLLGLLGTVTGMIAAFGILSTTGMNQPTAITGGVAEALIATFDEGNA